MSVHGPLVPSPTLSTRVPGSGRRLWEKGGGPKVPRLPKSLSLSLGPLFHVTSPPLLSGPRSALTGLREPPLPHLRDHMGFRRRDRGLPLPFFTRKTLVSVRVVPGPQGRGHPFPWGRSRGGVSRPAPRHLESDRVGGPDPPAELRTYSPTSTYTTPVLGRSIALRTYSHNPGNLHRSPLTRDPGPDGCRGVSIFHVGRTASPTSLTLLRSSRIRPSSSFLTSTSSPVFSGPGTLGRVCDLVLPLHYLNPCSR